MAFKFSTTFILAMALSSLLSIEARVSPSSSSSSSNTNLLENVCFGSQFPRDCSENIPKYVGDDTDDVTYTDILVAGLKLLAARADEGIEGVEKLKAESEGVKAARLGMVEAYYKLILGRSQQAISAVEGKDIGSLEFELDSAVKTTSECNDLLPKDSPVQAFTAKIHMAVKNNLDFGNYVNFQ